MTNVRGLSAEELFILECCACETDETKTEAALKNLCDKNLNWRHVIELALAEGVMPSVYRRVDSIGCVPEPAKREFRFHFQDNAIRNRALARDLLHITSLFESHGITPIVFKGPVLALTGYGDVTMRQFSDLDLLVRRSEMPYAIRLLSEEGFVPQSWAAEVITNYEQVFLRPGSIAVLDLHWTLMPTYFPYMPDPELVRRRAVRLRLEDGEVTTLVPPDQMLLTCVHGAKHGWEWLGMIADVAALLRIENGYDWPALCKEAKELGSLSMLLLGLMLAHKALAAPVPSLISELARRDRIVTSLVPHLLGFLFSARRRLRIDFFRHCMLPLRTIGSRRARLTFVVGCLRPSLADWQFVPLPKRLFPLYYLIRPLRALIQRTPRLVPRWASPKS